MLIRSLRIAQNRLFSTTTSRPADFSHTIIGAGVVGLAVGAELSKHPSNSVLIVDKNDKYGQETSSRNSEVIHAGLYYPVDSLKTELCLMGKQLIYEECEPNGVELLRCGKWIVAQHESQYEYLAEMHRKSKQINVLTEFIDLKRARELEPSINVGAAVLNSPTTGIISAHSLMDYLLSVFQSNGGELALGSKVTGLEYIEGLKEYSIQTTTQENEEFAISSVNVVNCAGLYAPVISNLLLPEDRLVQGYYAKGNYFAYQGNPGIRRLIYPCPTPGVVSLGTHLTLDLGGQVRFGPDLEWIQDLDSEDIYKVNEGNLRAAFEEVKKYMPSVELSRMSGSYSGIRQKLVGEGVKDFQDFVIREEKGYPGFVNCLGIESPGLTASMGIAKYVAKFY